MRIAITTFSIISGLVFASKLLAYETISSQTQEIIDNLNNEDINNLKILLANKTTEMLHGKKEAEKSEKIAKETFSDNSTGSNLPSIKRSERLRECHSVCYDSSM